MSVSHCVRCGYPLVKGSDGKWLCFCTADPKGFAKKQAAERAQAPDAAPPSEADTAEAGVSEITGGVAPQVI